MKYGAECPGLEAPSISQTKIAPFSNGWGSDT